MPRPDDANSNLSWLGFFDEALAEASAATREARAEAASTAPSMASEARLDVAGAADAASGLEAAHTQATPRPSSQRQSRIPRQPSQSSSQHHASDEDGMEALTGGATSNSPDATEPPSPPPSPPPPVSLSRASISDPSSPLEHELGMPSPSQASKDGDGAMLISGVAAPSCLEVRTRGARLEFVCVHLERCFPTLSTHGARRAAARNRAAARKLVAARLPSNRLFAAPDGRGGVGVLLATRGGGIGDFVAATHVRAPLLWGGRLLVSLDPNALPNGRSARSVREREVLSHSQAAAAADAAIAIGKVRHILLQEKAPDRTVPAFVPPRPAGITPLSLSSWRAVMAWGYNISFGLVAFVLLVSLVLGAQQSNSSAERLRASGMTLEEWWRAVSLAFTWTCFQSFVLIDFLKALMLTLTSPVFMHRLPKGSLRRLLGTQLLRNFHKFIEGVM